MYIERREVENGYCYDVWNTNYAGVIANARILEKGDYILISNINVNREYRGIGIGTKLLKQIISDFKDRDIILWCFRERIEWYKKFSFEVENEDNNIIKLCKKSIRS